MEEDSGELSSRAFLCFAIVCLTIRFDMDSGFLFTTETGKNSRGADPLNTLASPPFSDSRIRPILLSFC